MTAEAKQETEMKIVTLEVPLGEIAMERFASLIALGILPRPMIGNLTGKEKFNAQGLEGKASFTLPRPLAEALLKGLPPYRGRIVTGKNHENE